MNFLTEEKIEEKSINEFIENDLYELKKNKEFKLFSLNDKDINGNYTDNFELISQPEYDEVYEDMDIFEDYVVVYMKKRLIPTILIHDIKKKEKTKISLDSIGELKPRVNKSILSKKVEFEFSSPLTYKNLYEISLNSKKLKLIYENIFTNKSFDKNDFVLERISAPSQDGELIPMTILHKKNLKKNRKNKTLFIAYGSYGLNLELDFNVVNLAAAELDWVIVYCHVRGGSEKGQNWHFEGKLLNKSNSINDYLSCIYHLVQCGYTHPNYIAGYGTSAGGLVVAQSANIAPELFRAVCLSHPFVDILSTLIDKDLPLTIPDYEEFGNPLENKEDYFNILSFSPYENISNQEYPAIYVSTSMDDPRVPYWGVLKYVEKLRTKIKQPNRIPEFLEKNICVRVLDSGHFGPVNKEDSLKERIWEMMWLDKMLIEKDNLLI